ncbi:MAG: hypothetical protein KJO43_06830, partial [Phycisphaerae bacterium]|nr:hypothetical protein [Phycisphaerae bacterium]
TIVVQGDFGAVVEWLDVFIGDEPVATFFQTDGADCPDRPNSATLTLTNVVFNAFLDAGGGGLEITMVASAAVDPDPELCSSSVVVGLAYQASTDGDLNGNGVPDDCECLTDLDGSGDTGFLDLITILSEWGSCEPGRACLGDLDLSGDVGFLDLLAILSRWGPCT